MIENSDPKVVEDFGLEWTNYDQSLSELNLEEAFDQYFSIFPSSFLHSNSVGFDAGCGSGRWAKYIAPKVKHLFCIDASYKAIQVAQRNLIDLNNCSFECSSIDKCNLPENSMDFGYSLGVLHHIPDTTSALKTCVSKLKRNSPFLVYLYYKFDNKPFWFKLIWKMTDIARRIICLLPFNLKLYVSRLIALIIYFPLARLSFVLERLGVNISNIPLSDYRNKSFYFMKTDALDRFGTRLEKRFTKTQIFTMLKEAGLSSIEFSEKTPFWVAIGYKE